MVIDHIGVVVKSLEAGIANWESAFGYRQMTQMVVNTRQKVKVVFMTKEDSITVKLIEPVDESSPIYKLAQRGGGLHHICFRCKEMSSELVRLRKLGLRVLVEPQPGEAFDNGDIAFIFAKQGLNIELIQTDKKAFPIPQVD